MRFLFGPFLLFAGLFKVLIVVLVIVFLVRVLSHRHDHPGHWHGHHQWDSGQQDPRRVAAFRYAAGKIDRAEFDRINAALDASAPAPQPPYTPPAPPAPPVA